MSDPIERRKFQYTSLSGNNNKFYLTEVFSDGRFVVTYGRVGDAGAVKDYGIVDSDFVRRKIREKQRKGYVEVQLHTPTVVASDTTPASADPKVSQLVSWIFSEAGERIAQYLATSVDALSQSQIDLGRSILSRIYFSQKKGDRGRLSLLVQDYYNTIPTQLPRRIDPDKLVDTFVIADQENRLNQLEAALSTYTVTQAGGTQLSALGAEIKAVPESHNAYDRIHQMLSKTLRPNGVRVKDIFAVRIPQERTAYDAETFGAHHVLDLFHGTNNPNVRHILKSGLIIPRYAANGSRFGRGIYFSDAAWRSYMYTGSSYGVPKMLFIASVKVGNPWKDSGSNMSLTQAPAGYHSVWGTGSWSNRGDEIVVYKTSQQTLRAIVTVE